MDSGGMDNAVPAMAAAVGGSLVSEDESLNEGEQELYSESECQNPQYHEHGGSSAGGVCAGSSAGMVILSASSRVPPAPVSMMAVDPEPHMSSQFYTFNQASHRLMVGALMAGRHPTPEEIRSVATPAVLASWRGVWKDRHEDTAYLTGWRRIQDKLQAQVDDLGNEVLFFKNNPYQFVPFIEQWAGIVQEFHVGADFKHLGHKETLDRMRQVWTVGAKFYGVPESFVKVCISTCPGCGSTPEQGLVASTRGGRAVGNGGSHQSSRRRRFEYTESFEVMARDVPQRLQHLAAKYKVVLCIRQKYIRYKPFLAEVKDYCCHRGGEPTGRKPGVLKRKRYMSKRCGCSFRIRAIVPITNYDEKEKTFSYQEEGVATFKLYAVHSGHEPGPHEGSARIIHRFVDPGSLSEELDAASEREEEEARQSVMRQLQELQMELGTLEQKLESVSVDVLNNICQDLSGTMQRLHRIDKACMNIPASASSGGQQHTSEEVGLSEHWVQDEMIREQEKTHEEQHAPQMQRRPLKRSTRSCARCGVKETFGGSGLCKSCDSLVRQSAACSEEGSIDSRNAVLVGMQQVSAYCATENDKWYEGMACSLDTANTVELGFGHAIS